MTKVKEVDFMTLQEEELTIPRRTQPKARARLGIKPIDLDDTGFQMSIATVTGAPQNVGGVFQTRNEVLGGLPENGFAIAHARMT